MSDWKVFYRDDHHRDVQSTHTSKEAAIARRSPAGNGRQTPDADVWRERTDDWLKKAGAAFFPTA